MLSPYRTQSNVTNKRSKRVSKTNLDNNSHREHDLKRPQMTSKDTDENVKKVNPKNKLEGGDPNNFIHSNRK